MFEDPKHKIDTNAAVTVYHFFKSTKLEPKDLLKFIAHTWISLVGHVEFQSQACDFMPVLQRCTYIKLANLGASVGEYGATPTPAALLITQL